MDNSVFNALGGVGLFLLGMLMLTDGLRALAGTALRRLLRRSTRNPFAGVVAGAVATALVQSSSATTVAVVGFVGAGLMSFQQTLGIIFGANIGTTATGWLVAVLGFKLQLGTAMMPLLLAGILLRIFAPGRWKHAGWALAGFSLLFVGIAAMQQGMGSLGDLVTPADFPADTLIGRLELVLIGVVITVVTQSSSAGLAAALAALAVGAISFVQAAALVIGMNVGTTFTALLVTIGGSTALRRTGVAHLVFNLFTGIVAFFLLEPLTGLAERWTTIGGVADPQLGLAAFHTAFNVLGVALVIGFTGSFAALVIRLVPERGLRLTAHLDDRLLADPAAATDAAAATVWATADALFSILSDQLGGGGRRHIERRLDIVGGAEEQARHFAERIRTDPAHAVAHRRHTALIHALDHLVRLYHRCRQQERIDAIAGDPVLARLGRELAETVAGLAAETEDIVESERVTNLLRKRLRRERHQYRETTIHLASTGGIDTPEAMLRLDGMRWLHRVSYHVWRIVHHEAIARSEEVAADRTPAHDRDLEPAIEARED